MFTRRLTASSFVSIFENGETVLVIIIRNWDVELSSYIPNAAVLQKTVTKSDIVNGQTYTRSKDRLHRS